MLITGDKKNEKERTRKDLEVAIFMDKYGNIEDIVFPTEEECKSTNNSDSAYPNVTEGAMVALAIYTLIMEKQDKKFLSIINKEIKWLTKVELPAFRAEMKAKEQAKES